MVGQCNVLGTQTLTHVHLIPGTFFQFHLEETWGMDVQIKQYLKNGWREVKLLLSANRKSYMSHRSAQQCMTLSDLTRPFHGTSVPSVWEGHALWQTMHYSQNIYLVHIKWKVAQLWQRSLHKLCKVLLIILTRCIHIFCVEIASF